ncbi:MAG: membrane-bound lytic murein transglycosylase MltF [Desulfobacterium sp.]|nr:membrane-bound lytic murein transglycosylase MltF [Desulfobacterium sp.]
MEPFNGFSEAAMINCMNRITRNTNLFVVFLFIIFCAYMVWDKNSENASLDNILKRGEITVITLNNAHCYYFYKDQPMGFEYELAKAFAEYLGVKLVVKVVDIPENLIPVLKKYKDAFIAANITISPERKKEVAFSNSYMNICQRIIIRKNIARYIKTKKDLEGQYVYVRKGSPYEDQLKKLKEQGINIKIAPCENNNDEELIEKVAQKKIKITIAYSNIANLNRRYNPQVVIAGAISDFEPVSWAVERHSKTLLLRINDFFNMIKNNGKYASIRNRYYSGIDSFDNTDIIIFYVMMKTRFPIYSQIIKEASFTYGFDWRLVTAMAYQESRFDPFAQSYAGAYGFMQLTPETAISLGSTNIFDPEQSIYTGLKHLKNLYNYYDTASELNRLLIALAAYNVGEGHISDAMKLAVNKKMDPKSWASISKVLPLLSEQRYYSKAKYGYCRGSETVDYINQIMHYYEILKKDEIKHKKKHYAENNLK